MEIINVETGGLLGDVSDNKVIIPRGSRRDIVLASYVRPSVHSVRPHFLSVRNHISVPIGQIKFILGTND